MDDIPIIAINHRKEIIPALTFDFEIGKVGLQHIIGEFSLMMELIGCKDKIMFYTFQQTSLMQNTIKAWLWNENLTLFQ